MRKQEKKVSRIWDGVKRHVLLNLKLYLIVSIFFLIGIVVGVIFANNVEIEVKEQTDKYIATFINCIKTDYQIDLATLLKSLIKNDILFAFLLWFMGCTVIGIPIVYGLVLWKGFSLSYAIASIIFSLGMGKGILFCILTLLFQNVLIIPATLALAVSGIKLYQSIMKDKRKENIKLEIVRHTMFSFFMLLILILSSFIETYISSNLVSVCANYF